MMDTIKRSLRLPVFLARLSLVLAAALPAMLPAAAVAAASTAASTATTSVRVGVLEFGTVNWELATIQERDLAKKYGIDLKIIPLASGDAATVALQGGAVDVIVTDWIWVSRQRAAQNYYSFVPYSVEVGAVMVGADSGIRQLADLRGKKLGIAGGPSDKSWLLLRAYAQRKLGVDLATYTEPHFAAPPLLNELSLRGQVDAALNAWPYAARLEVAGMHELIALPEILHGLGIANPERPVAMLGWVFRDDWAAANREAIGGFLAASYEAKAILAASDAQWDLLRPKMRAPDNAVFTALRTRFRAGIPTCFDDTSIAAIASTFKVLAETGGEKLVGKSRTLSPGTFWSGYTLPSCKARQQ